MVRCALRTPPAVAPDLVPDVAPNLVPDVAPELTPDLTWPGCRRLVPEGRPRHADRRRTRMARGA